MPTGTLHVRTGHDKHKAIEATLNELENGDIDPKPATLHVESLETFGRIFRPANLEVLQAIAKNEPTSVDALMEHVDHEPGEVNQSVSELADYGLIELGGGKPTVWYDEIDATLSL